MYLSVGVVAAAASYTECHLPGKHSLGRQGLTDFQLGPALLQDCGGLADLQRAQACRQQVTEGMATSSSCESHCSFISKICLGKLPKYILDFLQCAWLLLSSRHVVCISSNTGMNIYIYMSPAY